MDSIITFVYY